MEEPFPQDPQTALALFQFTIEAAIHEWLTQKALRTGSQKTRRAYGDTLASFRAALAPFHLDLLGNPVDVARVATLWASTRTLRRLQPEDALVQPVSASTYNQRLAIVSSWYTFVQETYHLDLPNPIKGHVKRRPVQAYAAALPVAPDVAEQGMEEIDRRTLKGLRDYALLTVALATGRRASELVGLHGRDLLISRGKERHVTLTFHCKGGKIRRDRLDAEVSAILLEYLVAQFGEALVIGADQPLWVSYSRQNKGQAIGTRTLSEICARSLETSKVHATRHSFAVGMIRSHAPITELAARLGHTDIRITQLYAQEVMGDENPYAEQLTARFGFKRRSNQQDKE
jgi:site-specific recombinase XerD